MDFEGEGLNFAPVVGNELRVGAGVLGRELGNVVALVVVAGREFGVRGLGLVAAEVAVGGVALVLELLVEWEGEEGLAEGVLAADFGVGEGVAGDVEEACFCKSAWFTRTLIPEAGLIELMERHEPFLLMKLRACSANSCFPPG